MNDWIEEKAARIKRRQKQAQEERQSGIDEADAIHTEGRDVLEQLEAVVGTDIEKCNANFPNVARQRIESVAKSTPNEFVVHETGYPSAKLRAIFDSASMSIQFVVIKLRAIGEGEYNIKGVRGGLFI